jgi:hypothetical protein
MHRFLVIAILASAVLPTAAAIADPPPWAPAHGWRKHHRENWEDRAERRPDPVRNFEERRLTARDAIWRGHDGRYYCHHSDGTTGLIVGGTVGALVGRSLDDGRDRTAGTVIGMAGGALLGRAIDRGDLHCR